MVCIHCGKEIEEGVLLESRIYWHAHSKNPYCDDAPTAEPAEGESELPDSFGTLDLLGKVKEGMKDDRSR